MRTGFKLLEGVTSTGAGAAVDTSTFDRFTFFIEGTGITYSVSVTVGRGR